MNIFSTETGARARATLASLFALVTALSVLLESTVDLLDVLPQGQYVVAAAAFLASLVPILGRFTALGNKDGEVRSPLPLQDR